MKKKRAKPQETLTPAEDRDARYEQLTGGGPVYAISLEEAPLGIQNFLPDYRYRFDGATDTCGDEFIQDFETFLRANEYLVLDDHPPRAFADGFARGIAVAALFIDSQALRSRPGPQP